MSLVLAVLAQAVTSRPPERIDLTIPQPCAAQKSTSEEIVVCARPDSYSPYRLKQPAPAPATQVPKAEIAIADGVAVGAETESANVGGFTSNRLMARIKIKF
ncbi:hypothetical protein LZ496_08730 [Sphingomonas sp. NSE70-1]|uniref:Uncharacterized protein n=1 Tax=Sphingomonas caseinilyticus TaxID=2908205 RepID=A0ABT0RV32_9SPHN|nr:hypothetical protein [Sphingomonas caseinilyticus]MCL6698863.1 hypothetical protein [Sphingomonas caseinilyticus]